MGHYNHFLSVDATIIDIEHGDSRQKNIIMKTTNNMSENKSTIFLSWRWKLAALKYFNLSETPLSRQIWINLIEGQV